MAIAPRRDRWRNTLERLRAPRFSVGETRRRIGRELGLQMEPITNAELAEAMLLAANEVMRIDGDRDYMNPSDMKVQQTTAIADVMRMAASRLAPK